MPNNLHMTTVKNATLNANAAYLTFGESLEDKIFALRDYFVKGAVSIIYEQDRKANKVFRIAFSNNIALDAGGRCGVIFTKPSKSNRDYSVEITQENSEEFSIANENTKAMLHMINGFDPRDTVAFKVYYSRYYIGDIFLCINEEDSIELDMSDIEDDNDLNSRAIAYAILKRG